MFHIGIATQHPPLPDPSQLSELGIDFIRQCLTIDADARPTALDLLNHPWIVELEERVNLAFEDEMGTSSATNSLGSTASLGAWSEPSVTTPGSTLSLSSHLSSMVLEEDEEEYDEEEVHEGGGEEGEYENGNEMTQEQGGGLESVEE